MFEWLRRLFKPKPELELFLRVAAVEFDRVEPDALSRGFVWMIEPSAKDHLTRATTQRILYDRIYDYFILQYPNERRSVLMDWKDGKPFLRCGHVFFNHYGAALELSEIEPVVMQIMNNYGTCTDRRHV
jgi:hypothetical protein